MGTRADGVNRSKTRVESGVVGRMSLLVGCRRRVEAPLFAVAWARGGSTVHVDGRLPRVNTRGGLTVACDGCNCDCRFAMRAAGVSCGWRWTWSTTGVHEMRDDEGGYAIV